MQFTFTFPGGSGTTINTTSVSVPTSAWSNKTATVSVSGVTSSSNVIMAYAEATWDVAKAAVIRVSAVGTNSITLKCENVPTGSVTLNSPYTEIEATSSNFNIYINGTNSSKSHGMSRHTIKAYESVLSMDDTVIRSNVTWPNTNAAIYLFARSSNNAPFSYAKGIRIYHLKMWQNGALARDFYPCYRNNDNAAGLFDSVNRVFYPNLGSGSIVAGPAV